MELWVENSINIKYCAVGNNEIHMHALLGASSVFIQDVEQALRVCSACPAKKALEDGDGSIRCLLLGGGLMAGPPRGRTASSR